MASRRGRWTSVLAAAALVSPLTVAVPLATPAGAAGAGDFSFFTVPASATDGPRTATDVTPGPDGNMWFLAQSTTGQDDVVGRITPSGAISTFPLGTDGGGRLTTGPDGSLWAATDALTEVAVDGTTTVHGTPGVGLPAAIIDGPRDHLWILYGSKVKEVDTNGSVVATFRLPSPGNDLAVGADGNLWVTFSGFPAGVHRLSPTGRVSTFLTDPFDGVITPTTDLLGIASGADGRLWTVEDDDTVPFPRAEVVICAFTTNGTRDCLPGTPQAEVITNGPDGALWSDADERDPFLGVPSRLVRVDTAGAATEFGDPDLTDVSSITAGSDADVWFTQEPNEEGATVGRFEVGPIAPPDCNEAPIAYHYGDVARAAPYSVALDWATCHGIVGPSVKNRFRPDAALLRSQMVDLLWRFMDSPVGAPDTHFSDVPADATYHDALDWAADAGVVGAGADNRFRPVDATSRSALLVNVWRATGSPVDFPAHGFADVPGNPALGFALDWAVDQRLIPGPPSRPSFRPADRATRSFTVRLLSRLASTETAWVAFEGPYPSTARF